MGIQTDTAWVHVPVRRKWRNSKAPHSHHSHHPRPQPKRCKTKSDNLTREAQPVVDISSHVCNKCPVHEPNWLTEESRDYVAWDGFHEKGSRRYALTNPPGLAMSQSRVEKGVLPPSFDIPALPAVLPQTRGSKYTKQNSTPIMWPHMPGAPTLALSLKECVETFLEMTNETLRVHAQMIYALALWAGGEGDKAHAVYSDVQDRLAKRRRACAIHNCLVRPLRYFRVWGSSSPLWPLRT